MKLLLDTNIFIPLEPATPTDLAPNTEVAATLSRLAQAGGHTLFLHPASSFDIGRDQNADRAGLRRVLSTKYPQLPDPPPLTPALTKVIGTSEAGSNNWVDDMLVAALEADAVDLLVSEDKGVRKKARRMGLDGRVLTLDEAIRILGGTPPIVAPPAVRSVKAHALPKDDPIFESFREDYPGFDDWFARCRRQHRQAWKIDGSPTLAAFCIVKDDEEHPGLDLGARPLKLCSFKVAPAFNGFKYGELLLKTVFDHSFSNENTGIFVTAFEKHGELLELLEDFGFKRKEQRTELGELILAKKLCPDAALSGLDYHIAFGPPRFDVTRPWYIVPIQPRYSDVLFPETANTKSLFEGRFSFGNAIRKAYLCHSACRQLLPGDVLAFYRTQRSQGLVAIGVVEDTLVSHDAAAIARAVARRTVYSSDEIKNLCHARTVLAIRFRQAKLVTPRRSAVELTRAGVFTRAPQSIMRVGREGTEWLIDQFAA